MCVEVLDTYSTNYPNVIPSQVILEFLSFHPENVAKSIFALCVSIATIGMYFVFLNQLLADKYGRKLLLALTVLGMAVASLLLSLSTSIIEYTIYLFMLYVFFSSDIWTIYVNEEAPSDKRALWTNIVLMGGVAGALILPVFRSIFITETTSNWRGMTYFEIFWGIPLSFIIFFTLKETIKYKELKEMSNLKVDNENRLKKNLSQLFQGSHRKEFISILLISFLWGLNYLFISLGESFMADSPNLNQDDINIVVTIMSVSVVGGYLITGIVADKFGRKPLIYVFSILLPVAIILAVYGITLTEGAILFVSIGAALANVSYWGLGVVLRIVTLEIIPTESRGTGSGIKSLIGAFGITGGLAMSSLLILLVGLGTTFLIYSFFLLICIPITYKFLKETKSIDLSTID